MHDMWIDMSNHSWGWLVFGGLHMIIFWVLVILLIAALIKWLSGSNHGKVASTEVPATDILKKRYAHGEISREEYLKMKVDIEK